MKKWVWFLVTVLLMGCTSNSEVVFPESPKGYEVYAWEKNGESFYTLITGTNRYKSYAEITDQEERVEDDWVKKVYENRAELKDAISQMPEKQYFIFIDYTNTPNYIVDELELYAESYGHNWNSQE